MAQNGFGRSVIGLPAINGEKVDLTFLQRNKVLEKIQSAKFKEIPSNFKKLSSEEIVSEGRAWAFSLRKTPADTKSLHYTYREKALEHFSCCWVARKWSAAALSLWKTPIDNESLHYTYRRKALALEFPTHAFA
ncbi:hypothetical protein AB4Y89_16835 [Terriglobus sp. 2YAB30_2]|uniref:hypothetical protein n=1 Tax=Terriglobus sp. 2YAB30_2 TaxID=3233023 RepID=UPI003F9A44F9